MLGRISLPSCSATFFALVTILIWCVCIPASKAADWIPDHIVIVIEENLSSRNLVPELTYLTELMHDSANFTNSHGIDHPSQPNYLALFSGSTQGTGSEAHRNADGSNPIINGHTQVGSNNPILNTPLTTPNLGAALFRAGRTFTGYSEDLPFAGFAGNEFVGERGSSVDYQRKHNPWVNWQALHDGEIGGNQLPSNVNLPFSAFPNDDAGFSRLPTVAIVVPNQINDGHQSATAPSGTNYGKTMDSWLRLHIEPYRQWALTHNSLLIITWDEDEDDNTPVIDANGSRIAKHYTNLIPTIMAGQGVVPGIYPEYIDHYAVLRTIENFYGLAPLAAGDAKAAIITGAFRKR